MLQEVPLLSSESAGLQGSKAESQRMNHGLKGQQGDSAEVELE